MAAAQPRALVAEADKRAREHRPETRGRQTADDEDDDDYGSDDAGREEDDDDDDDGVSYVPENGTSSSDDDDDDEDDDDDDDAAAVRRAKAPAEVAAFWAKHLHGKPGAPPAAERHELSRDRVTRDESHLRERAKNRPR